MNIKHPMVKKCVGHIMFKHPFWGSLLLEQNIKEDYNCDTFYVDGTNLGYNPDFANRLTFNEVCGVLIHELYHLLLLHHTRKGMRKHSLWNEATDYAINIIVTDMGFSLPKGVLLDQKYRDKSAEDIYRALDKKQDEDSKSNKGQGEPDSNGDSKGPGNTDSDDKNPDKSDKEGKGNPAKDAPIEDLAKTLGEVRESKEDNAEEKIKGQIIRAVATAKQAGNMPSAAVIEAVEQAKEQKYSWEELLNRFITENSATDYSFECPDRRFLYSGFVLPDMDTPAIGEIVFAIDTSGSVSTAEVQRLVSEVQYCLDIIAGSKESPKFTVIYCDAAIQHVEVIDENTVKANPKGGGGTRFSPVFEYIEKSDIDVDALFYVTDGYCSDFGNIVPEYPVLWCLTEGSTDSYTKIAPFGETIKLEVF